MCYADRDRSNVLSNRANLATNEIGMEHADREPGLWRMRRLNSVQRDHHQGS